MDVYRTRARLAGRLREQREEIEDSILARVHGVPASGGQAEPEYVQGLRVAVAAGLDYATAAIELGPDRLPSVPPALVEQAGRAARYGVGLDVVLRRCVGGYTLFGEFMLREVEKEPRGAIPLQELFHGQTSQLDGLIRAVSEEYQREAGPRPESAAARRAAVVRRLLAGELLDSRDLPYEIHGWHLAMVVSGLVTIKPLESLAARAERRLLSVQPHANVTWAWLGGGSPADVAEVAGSAEELLPADCTAAIGEPGAGLTGWRLSHNQAKSGMALAVADGRKVVRYRDVGLLASVARDETLVRSLRQLYLMPLEDQRDGGESLRDAVRTYLEVGRSISSAAAVLRVNRQTLRNRLRTFEEKVGRAIDSCGAELEVALRLEQTSISGRPPE